MHRLVLRQAKTNSKLLFQNNMTDYPKVITAQSKVLADKLDWLRFDATSNISCSARGRWR